MAHQPYNVLFLCTGNSARSILAEAILARWGKESFSAFSAGSHPKPAPHPLALAELREMNHDTTWLRSKSWDEFEGPGAPTLDFVITVCDNAAGETCPVWPGQPMSAHWGMADPAAVEGSEALQRQAFRQAYTELEARIKLFTSLPFEELDRLTLLKRLEGIGKASLDPSA